MNNTTTRSLSVAAIFIAATLVVGATLAATMLTPAAAVSKKGNGNGNTDTKQKNKQDGTQSGFDDQFNQEGQNLICTHPDDNATCSQEGITSTLQATTGTLLVKKVVDCKGDPQCIRFNSVDTFIIRVTGNDPNPPVFQGSSSTVVTLGQGTYTIAEIPQPNGMLPPTFSGDCTSTGSGSFSATGTISANNLHQTCTITNVNACLIPGFCQ